MENEGNFTRFYENFENFIMLSIFSIDNQKLREEKDDRSLINGRVFHSLAELLDSKKGSGNGARLLQHIFY
jgi:hypothetical protein